MNVCDAFGLDPAQLRKVERLMNEGSLELRPDIWDQNKLKFFTAKSHVVRRGAPISTEKPLKLQAQP